jgi:hypothetical protein
VGIQGNEVADRAAKEAALTGQVHVSPIPSSDLRPIVNRLLFHRWQEDWAHHVGNKLHAVKPQLGVWETSSRPSRLEERRLARLRIGHSHLTHGYLLRRQPPPTCAFCGERLTIRHLLMECHQLAPMRVQLGLPADIGTMLGNDNQMIAKVFTFLQHAQVLTAL